MAKATSKQVRASEEKRTKEEARITLSEWVKIEHKDEAREAGKKAFKKAVNKFKK